MPSLPSCVVIILIYALPRFYPGIAMPSFAQIEEPGKPAGTIDAPELEASTECDATSPGASRTDTKGRNLRGTKVVGSLDHAILPMPPVCDDCEGQTY